jgi:hypothetical protein
MRRAWLEARDRPLSNLSHTRRAGNERIRSLGLRSRQHRQNRCFRALAGWIGQVVSERLRLETSSIKLRFKS